MEGTGHTPLRGAVRLRVRVWVDLMASTFAEVASFGTDPLVSRTKPCVPHATLPTIILSLRDHSPNDSIALAVAREHQLSGFPLYHAKKTEAWCSTCPYIGRIRYRAPHL